jgi:hypothetical protein
VSTLSSSIVERIGAEILKVIRRELLKTEPIFLPAEINKFLADHLGIIPIDSIKMNAKIFIKIGKFEGIIPIDKPPLNVK